VSISITEKKQVPYMILFEFCSDKYGTKFPAIVSYAYEIASKYGCNGTLLILWACVRSKGFTSKEYRENLDIFSLGGKYDTFRNSIATGASEFIKYTATDITFRNSIATGASEFIKYTATDMLQEQEQIETLWTEAWAYHDKVISGIVVPPPPPQKPTEPPKPPAEPAEPDAPAKPSEPWNVKKIAAWLAGICSALGFVTALIPGFYDDIIVKVVKIVADLIANM
jgi:hypothetical protein